MSTPERAPWTVERAETPEQRRSAAAILVAHLPEHLRAMRQREIEGGAPRDVLLARRGNRAIGALAALRLPGQLSLVWPPRIVAPEGPGDPQQDDTSLDAPLLDAHLVDASWRGELAAALISAALEAQQRDGISLAQAMLAADDDPEPFVAAGFSHLAQLVYLQASRRDFPAEPPRRLMFDPLQPGEELHFRNVLTATYEDTLDCPAVHQVLSVDATLDSYRGQPGYEPRLWFFARHQAGPLQGQDAGCLILAAHSTELWELVYMGLVPSARGQGLGAELVAQALWLAGQQNVEQVALAVDAANAPALAAYRRHGFEPFDELAVYMRPLR